MEERAVAIAVGKDRMGKGPRNADRRVIVTKRSFLSRIIKTADFVNEMRLIAHDAKAMRVSLRNKQLLSTLSIEIHPLPFSKGRARGADINHHIKDCAMDHRNQLSLPGLTLKMHATDRPLSGEGVVVLHKFAQDPSLVIERLAKSFFKKTPLISEDARLNDFYPWQGEFFHFHR
jgi:hypothetical protein